MNYKERAINELSEEERQARQEEKEERQAL